MDKVSLLSNDTVFIEVFNVRTAHILRGLEWTNVCVTGEIVLVGLPALFQNGCYSLARHRRVLSLFIRLLNCSARIPLYIANLKTMDRMP